MSKVLVAGYYGCGNVGDDAILLGFLQGMQGKNVDVTVMSGNPEETRRMYGVQTINRRDMSEFGQAIASCDALVFAGGSIFQDVTSVKSVAYYSNLVRVAKKSNKKVVLLGQGIGPLNSLFGKQLAKGAFNSCDAICVRDPQSVKALKDVGYKGTPRVTADLAFLLPKPTVDPSVESYQLGGMTGVAVIPRPHGKGPQIANFFSELCAQLMKLRMMPMLVEMDREDDRPLIMEIEKRQGGKIPTIKNFNTPMQMMQQFVRLDGVISMRLHGGILASAMGLPPLMLSYDPKVSAFSQLMGLPTAVDALKANPTQIVEGYMAMHRDRDRLKAQIEKKVGELRSQAEGNIEVLLGCIGRS
ncbi:MAG: polysaccharide pyruvyl transferase CsaB [Armatimonadetes bacterium]|nr:polysaccharide pyruvyl transferase CsaB [Armatimonadota bacterium]